MTTELFEAKEVYVGRDFGGTDYEISADAIENYIAATGDDHPWYRTTSPLGYPVAPALVVHSAVFRTFDWKSWVAFAFLAILMYGASMLFFFAALEHLDVTVASVSLYLVPIFGVLMAAVILGERLSALAMAGSGIVLVATILIMKYDTSY